MKVYLLFSAREVVQESLGFRRMKSWYDNKAKKRQFSPGDKVLVLLPVNNNYLTARYHGPYVIQKKVNETDYVISTPDKCKVSRLCHINMLKQYLDGGEGEAETVLFLQKTDGVQEEFREEEEDDEEYTFQNSGIIERLEEKLSHLNDNHRGELQTLILNHIHLFTDVPCETDAVFHDIDWGCHSYQTNAIQGLSYENEGNG